MYDILNTQLYIYVYGDANLYDSITFLFYQMGLFHTEKLIVTDLKWSTPFNFFLKTNL